MFTHASARERVQGYLDVYRALHMSEPHVLAFTGMALLDAMSEGVGAEERPRSDAGEALRS